MTARTRSHGPRCRCRPALTPRYVVAQLTGYVLAATLLGSLAWVGWTSLWGDPAPVPAIAAPDTFGAPYVEPERPTTTPRATRRPAIALPDGGGIEEVDCDEYEDLDDLTTDPDIIEQCEDWNRP